MNPKPAKIKTCKSCGTSFRPMMPLASVCGPVCALTLVRAKTAKLHKAAMVKDRRETKAKLDKLKSRAQWAKEAQTAFNVWVRLRDAEQPCISCGRHHQGQYHAGHFLSVGACPELRFSELNVHKQCAPCNTHLSGNAVLYRKALIGRIGLGGVEMLEGPHPTRHYTLDELKAIKAVYTAKAKELKAQHDNA